MSAALAMFRKSNKDGDIKKAAQKVADPKKDTLTRLKHLRTVLGESLMLQYQVTSPLLIINFHLENKCTTYENPVLYYNKCVHFLNKRLSLDNSF